MKSKAVIDVSAAKGISTMDQKSIIEIIYICMSLDTTAAWIYSRLSRISPAPELSKFWREMAQEETRHVKFWKDLMAYAKQGMLPQIFSDPDGIISELNNMLEKANALFGEYDLRPSPEAMFNMAYRMEFFLLHPAFSLWFNFAGTALSEYNPNQDYEDHIDRFIQAIHIHGLNSPASELLGETLRKLKKINEEAVQLNLNDPITGTLNRKTFMNAVKPMLYLANRRETRVGFLLVEIDSLADLYYSLGYDKSDSILKTVGKAIKGKVRASDLVGRYDQEKFCIFLYGLGDGTINAIADKIKSDIESTVSPRITLSIGGASAKLMFPDNPPEKASQLLHNAVSSLLSAKKSGLGQIAISE